MEGRFISYLRVSTKKQGQSGLGLDAQRAAVHNFLNGGNWELLTEFVEVESGKKADRPELGKALHLSKITGATLVIAKLDRLSRDAHFLLGLQKAGVRFVAVDMPQANELTVGILALVAEEERKAISQRTKAALVAAKARGIKLGSPKGAAHLQGLGNGQAVARIKEKARDFAQDLRAVVEDIRAAGVSTVRGIGLELERRAIRPARGNTWSPASVSRLLKRLEPEGVALG